MYMCIYTFVRLYTHIHVPAFVERVARLGAVPGFCPSAVRRPPSIRPPFAVRPPSAQVSTMAAVQYLQGHRYVWYIQQNNIHSEDCPPFLNSPLLCSRFGGHRATGRARARFSYDDGICRPVTGLLWAVSDRGGQQGQAVGVDYNASLTPSFAERVALLEAAPGFCPCFPSRSARSQICVVYTKIHIYIDINVYI